MGQLLLVGMVALLTWSRIPPLHLGAWLSVVLAGILVRYLLPKKADPRPFPEEGAIPVAVEPDIAELVPHFLENRRADESTLRDALEAGDRDTAQALGHQMKGIAGGFGFDYVSRAGAAMEEAGQDDRLEDARPWIEGLAEYVARITVQVSPDG